MLLLATVVLVTVAAAAAATAATLAFLARGVCGGGGVGRSDVDCGDNNNQNEDKQIDTGQKVVTELCTL